MTPTIIKKEWKLTPRQIEIVQALADGDCLVIWDSWDDMQYKTMDGERYAKYWHYCTSRDGKVVREDTLTKLLGLGIIRKSETYLGEHQDEYLPCEVMGEPNKTEKALIKKDGRYNPLKSTL